MLSAVRQLISRVLPSVQVRPAPTQTARVGHSGESSFVRGGAKATTSTQVTNIAARPKLAYAVLAEKQPLPPALDRWMDFEQNFIVRTVDATKIMSPTVGNQRVEFRPDTGNWFSLASVWIPEDRLAVAEASVPPELRDELIRDIDGVRHFRLFVHPESRDYYASFVGAKVLAEEHDATATASSRSLLVRSKKNPKKLFFVKVSLAVELGGVRRTVLRNESARAIGTSKYLECTTPALSQSFQFIPEVLSIIPKGWDQGGQIVRPLPKDVADGKSVLMPLFALYAQKQEGSLIQRLAARAGQTPLDYVRTQIIEPFVDAWVDWALNGIAMEAHAQNVLLELDRDGRATGRFFMRDLGGFELDGRAPRFRAEHLADAPVFATFEEDYYPKTAEQMQTQSLRTYFEGGFLFNVDVEMQRVQPGYIKGGVQNRFWLELSRKLAKASGLSPNILPRAALEHWMPLMLKLAQYRLAMPTAALNDVIIEALADAAKSVRLEAEAWLVGLTMRHLTQPGVPSAGEARAILKELRARWGEAPKP